MRSRAGGSPELRAMSCEALGSRLRGSSGYYPIAFNMSAMGTKAKPIELSAMP